MLGPATAVADEYETRVVGEDETVPSAYVSTVRPADDPRAGATVAEALDALPGVRVRSIGGLGSFGTVSIRGSTGSQVRLVLDGIPLATSASGVASVGDLSLESIDTIRVHRGAAPPALGGGAIGGVVELRSAEPGRRPRFAAATTFGSFETLRASALEVGRTDGVRFAAFAGTAYTRGDFAYYDDRGTPQNLGDDRTSVRENADQTSVEGGVGVATSLTDAWLLEAASSLWAEEQGLPGLGAFQSSDARLATERALAQTTITRLGAWGSAGLRLTGRALRDRFDDPAGEISVRNQRTDDVTLGAGATALATLGFGETVLRLAVGPEWERFRPHDDFGPPGRAPRPERFALALVAEEDVPLVRGRIVISPLVRIRHVADSFGVEAGPVGPRVVSKDVPARDLVSVRAGARAAVVPALTVRASIGTDQREPTFEELFGDRGAIVGNPELEPESAWTAEAGLGLATRRVRADAGVFHSEATDLIQLVQNSQRTAIPMNLGRTRIRGIETGVDLRPGAGLGIVVAYTLMDAENRSDIPSQKGKRVPGRPLHDVHAVVEERVGFARLAVDGDLVAGNFLDPANRIETPARVLFGVSLGLAPRWAEGLSLDLSVRNVLDQRVEDVPVRPAPPGGIAQTPQPIADYLGYPLPGRSVFLTLRYRDER